MAAEWYYTANRQQMGPVSWSELCQLAGTGLLKPTDLVWKDGMADWVRASSQGLFREGKPDFVPGGKADLVPAKRKDDDGDERPRRRREFRRDDEDNEDNDDRPRRRRPEGMPVGAKIGLIVGGVVALLLILSVTLFFLLKPGGGGGPAQDIPLNGLVFNDTLRANDKRDTIMHNPCKIFPVKFTANSTYTIDHRSNMFDAFLRLEDPSGQQVAVDDDGGRGFGGGPLDARIVYRANQTGTYRIIATSLDGRTGNFTLTVRKN
jgi:hypothetical protein